VLAITPHPRERRGSFAEPSFFRKRLASFRRFARTAPDWITAVFSTRRPLLVHIIPMRRCNLACTYCNEYDNFSKPVPLEVMKQRIDQLAKLGTVMVGVSGGEPLMHPNLDEIIRHVIKRGMLIGMLTNGYLLTEERILRLNRAGLEFLQISIDNVDPDDVSKKSLKVLRGKLVLLSRFAEFGVNINTVVGAGVDHPEDAIEIATVASGLGFSTSVGIVHDGDGNLQPLSEEEQRVYRAVKKIGKKGFGWLNKFEDNLAEGKVNKWRCRAGARYLYIDEDGLVHYCSQQRGYPAVPLESYTKEDIRREYLTEKSCAPHCTVACVQRISYIDGWRSPQTLGSRVPASGKLEAAE